MAVITSRRQDIERAKGLAILLVVFGHLVARADPPGVEWYEPLRRAVYTFHMPFFLYLSGMVAVFSGAAFAPPDAWPQLLRKRAERLLVPFFALGFLIVAGKAIARQLFFVDNAPASLAAGLRDLLWHTVNSPAISIWYLFVLFVLSIVTPALIWADHGRLRFLIVSTFLIYFLPLPQYFYLDHIGNYAVFFATGVCTAGMGARWNELIARHWRSLLSILVCALVLVAYFGAAWPMRFELLPIGILSMPALHGLVRHSAPMSAPVFLWLGRNSFMIYLFNTICIGLAKGVVLRLTTWGGGHFLPVALLLMLSGTLGPILLKKTLFHRIKLIDRYTA
jgi:fucose 4-O-acetylase-like acetyltransferase